jgi:hypothetical protein
MPSFCFYIPDIPIITSAKDVIREFNYIGVVTRVDFAPLGKKPGFKEHVCTDTKSAFVHVAELFTLGKVIETYIQTKGPYKFYISTISSEFWTLSKANKPIQGTMMNTSQIVANCRYLENKVEEQAAKLEQQATQLEEQAADIRALNEKLSGVHTVVYQLLGGLFCQKSQSQVMSEHIENLYPDSSSSSRRRFGEPDDSKWGIWPTTRQGDDCERRIADLEDDLNAAINAINDHSSRGMAADKKILELEQQVKDLTIEAVFTPYEEDKYGNMEMYELQDEDEDEDEDDERRFVPVPMEQMIEQRDYDEIHSVSTHSSMPELIYGNTNELDLSTDSSMPDLEPLTDDDTEADRLYNACGCRQPDYDYDYDPDADLEVGF